MHNKISDHPSYADDDDNETHYDTKIEIDEMFMHVYYLYHK